MQCRDAQFYLRLRRHGGDELGVEVAADLDRHLAGCAGCAADARAAESFDRAVGAAVRTVPVPTGLRDQLLNRASAHHGTVIRRKVYRVAAVAASLFVGVGLAFGLFSATRPRIDPTQMVMTADALVQNPDEELRRWLTGQNLPVQLPEPLDTDLLVSLGTERVQGADVPVAVFRHPSDAKASPMARSAKVYFFRTDGRYNLDALRDDNASHTAARVVADPRQFRGVTYVLLYPAGPDGLTPFLRPHGPTAARG